MNTNLLHNIINLLIVIIAALVTFDWVSVFGPKTGSTIIGVLSLLKLVINAVRDGLAGMVKPQPPVQS